MYRYYLSEKTMNSRLGELRKEICRAKIDFAYATQTVYQLKSCIKRPGSMYQGLPKSVYILFLANIINSLGNFVWPFLAIYLTDKMGMNKAEAGLIVTVSALAFVPGSLIGGKLADLIGRKQVFLVARLLAALALVPCAFLGTSPLVPALLIFTSFLSGATEPAINALVGDLTTPKTRQRAFSLLYLGHNVGFAVGPMLAGFLYQRYLPWIFIGDAFTTLISIVLVAVFVRETLGNRDTKSENSERGGLLAALLRRPALVMFSGVLIIYSFIYVQANFSLPILVEELFGLEGPRIFGYLMSVNAVTVVFCTSVMTRWTQKISPAVNVAIGGLFYAIGFGLVGMVSSIRFFVATTVIWTLGEILVAVNTATYIANNSPISHRGRLNSVVMTVSGTGHSLGPLIIGKLINNAGVGLVWPLCFWLGLGASGTILAISGMRAKLERNKASGRCKEQASP